MSFFGRTDSVDEKARSVLEDISEDAAPFDILRAVDQKAGEDVDPDDVVSRMRDLDDEVDAKLAAVDGQEVEQKDMREAAGVIADRTDMSQAGAMELLSDVMASIDEMDPSRFTDSFGDVVDEYYRGEVDQAAGDETAATETTDGDTSDMGENDNGVDQKEDEQMNPLDLVEEIGGADERENVENYAESVGKGADECAAEWVAENVPGVTVEGYGNDGGADTAGDYDDTEGAHDTAGGHDRDGGHDQMKDYDQKLEDLNLNERVADAVTSDEVLDEMAGAVAQKMLGDDELTDDVVDGLAQKMKDDGEFADELVETIDQKGDFVTTEDTVHTAPGGESQTVGEANAVTGGDSE